MAKLVSPEIAGELLDTTKAALMTMACIRKKENGVYPKWYISNGKVGGSASYVDIELIEHYNRIRKVAWNYATEKLYWILDDLDGYNMNDFAIILSEKTGHSVNSWNMFISRDMWSLPNGNMYDFKENRLFDFIRIMTRLVYGSLPNIREAI